MCVCVCVRARIHLAPNGRCTSVEARQCFVSNGGRHSYSRQVAVG